MTKRYAPSARDVRDLVAGISAALALWLVPFSALPWVIGAGVIAYAVLRMRFLRESTRVLLLWTVLCAVPVYLLIVNYIAMTDAACGEICGMASYLATFWMLVIFVAWLAVTGVILWLRERQSRPRTQD
jgi:hypothetical protein